MNQHATLVRHDADEAIGHEDHQPANDTYAKAGIDPGQFAVLEPFMEKLHELILATNRLYTLSDGKDIKGHPDYPVIEKLEHELARTRAYSFYGLMAHADRLMRLTFRPRHEVSTDEDLTIEQATLVSLYDSLAVMAHYEHAIERDAVWPLHQEAGKHFRRMMYGRRQPGAKLEDHDDFPAFEAARERVINTRSETRRDLFAKAALLLRTIYPSPNDEEGLNAKTPAARLASSLYHDLARHAGIPDVNGYFEPDDAEDGAAPHDA